MIAVAGVCLFTACDENAPVGIEILVYPDLLTVPQGGEPDLTGGLILVKYEDGSTKEVAMSSLQQRGLDVNTLDVQTLVLVYKEDGKSFSVTLEMRVELAAVDSIVLKTEGVKTDYLEGDSFQKSGLVVTANYVTGISADIQSYDVSPAVLTAETKAVKISYHGAVAEIPVTVVKKAPQTLTILSPITKNSYFVGESFDPVGLSFKVTYNDGNSEDFSLDKAQYQRADGGKYDSPLDAADNKVKIVIPTAYGDAIGELVLEVKEVLPVSMHINYDGTLAFEEGDVFSFPSIPVIYVTVTYNDGSEGDLVASEEFFTFDKTPLTLDKTGEMTIRMIAASAVSDTIDIVVTAPTVAAISFAGYPTLIGYTVGQTVDLTGLKLLVSMSNGYNYVLEYSAESGIVAEPAVVAEDTLQITVIYQGASESFAIFLYE